MSLCQATKPGLNPTYVHQCGRRATYGEWCFQHAHSIGGWRLVPPDAAAREPGIDVERLRPVLDEALRPYLALLRNPDDQNDKIIAGVASRMVARLASSEQERHRRREDGSEPVRD